MKTKTPNIDRSILRPVYLGAVLLLAFTARAQDLFEGDTGSGNINEFTSSGSESLFASGLANPSALAFNHSGDLFVASYSGDIYEFTPGGERTFASGMGFLDGLAVDAIGDVFVSDMTAGDIYKFTPGGSQSIFASGVHPAGLAFNSAGDLFQGDSGIGNIYEYTPGGSQSTFFNGGELLTGQVPTGLAFSGGNLFAAISGNGLYNSVIDEFTSGGTGGVYASLGQSVNPEGLAFDSAGNLYVADQRGGTILKIAPGGGSSSVFAGGLDSPFGLAFGAAPEPSELGFLAVGAASLLVVLRRRALEKIGRPRLKVQRLSDSE